MATASFDRNRRSSARIRPSAVRRGLYAERPLETLRVKSAINCCMDAIYNIDVADAVVVRTTATMNCFFVLLRISKVCFFGRAAPPSTRHAGVLPGRSSTADAAGELLPSRAVTDASSRQARAQRLAGVGSLRCFEDGFFTPRLVCAVIAPANAIAGLDAQTAKRARGCPDRDLVRTRQTGSSPLYTRQPLDGAAARLTHVHRNSFNG